MIGTKLAHYEITSHLGTGDREEVYQATVVKLGRSVPSNASGRVQSRRQNVSRDSSGRPVYSASLSHSNIAAIYGFEEARGRHFLVLELVPGETLARPDSARSHSSGSSDGHHAADYRSIGSRP